MTDTTKMIVGFAFTLVMAVGANYVTTSVTVGKLETQVAFLEGQVDDLEAKVEKRNEQDVLVGKLDTQLTNLTEGQRHLNETLQTILGKLP